MKATFNINGVMHRENPLSAWAQFFDTLRGAWVTSRFLNVELSDKGDQI